ncbi:MAG TPA: RICIN domain-containing protein, partial [Polyangia bacterium]|nr:RICIN domain-containing protein [Polyangia bacterium]
MVKNFNVRAGLFLTFVSGVFSAAAPAKADVVRTGYSVIVAGNSGKCLDISGASNTVGTAAIQWHCNFAGNEQWTLQPHNGAFIIVEQKNGQCLAAASTAAGAAIVQTTCTGAATQDWKLAAAAGGYQLVNQGSALCANVNGNSTADNAAIVQSSCSTASNFIWTVASGLMDPSAPVVAQADHSGQCLNVNGASTASGASIIQWPCAGSGNEQWKLVPAGAGYQVVSVSSGLCAAVTGSSTTAGASVVQLACSQAANMIWTLNVAGGAYQLVAQHSGQCLTVSGASQTNGAQVVQNTCTAGALNQSWSLSSATIPSSWTGVQTLAVNPIAVANLPSGKLLMWSAYDQYTYEGDIGTANGKTFTSVFDPATGSSSSILVTNTGDDMFCPGTANLPDGRILVNGGSSSPKTSIYDPTT